MDLESQARIKRFYRRQDACREAYQYLQTLKFKSVFKGCLIGRLLPRMLLKQKGVAKSAMSFSSTQSGKPYTASLHVFVLTTVTNNPLDYVGY